MIDEQRTLEIYGYTSDELTKCSGKPIIAVCEECKKYRDVNKNKYCDLCRSCSNRISTNKRYEDDEQRKKQSDRMIKVHNNDKEIRKRSSATWQGIEYDKWTGFTDKLRPHVLPETRCKKLNDRFDGCEAHHITRSIIVYIPKELHKHIRHNLKNGSNMGEMNALAIQYINGGM